jgi:hypothetical protein
VDEISQREKREILKDTFLSRAQADAEIEAQGRFKKQSPMMIVGAPQYPRQPASSPWHSDPVPPEPSFGVDIEFVGDLGGASPAQASTPCAVETIGPPDRERRQRP